MTRVYIALGSNLADPLHQVQSALNALAKLPQTQLSQPHRCIVHRRLGLKINRIT